MKTLKEFSLPLSGLFIGVHKYHYLLGPDFFKSFEESPVLGGDISADVVVDVEPETMVVRIRITGRVQAVCDRCLADIGLPVEGEYNLIVKYGDESNGETEIVYISEDTNSFNLAKYIHEVICLSLPISIMYDCQEEDPLPCDLKTLERLSTELEQPSGSEESEKEDKGASPWNVLKDIDLN